MQISSTSNIIVTYNFLELLKWSYEVKVVVIGGANSYTEPCLESAIRRQVQRGGTHDLMERLRIRISSDT